MKIDELINEFKLKDSFENGQLSDYIFDTDQYTVIFDEFEYVLPEANKGFNFLFKRGGHLCFCLTVDMSEFDYEFLGNTIFDELHNNRFGA